MIIVKKNLNLVLIDVWIIVILVHVLEQYCVGVVIVVIELNVIYADAIPWGEIINVFLSK